MNLVFSLRSTLEGKYGADGFAKIEAALNDYAQALSQPPLIVFLDDQDAMPSSGLSAIQAVNPGAVLSGIRNLLKAFSSISAIFIVGGDSIVPLWQIRNPIADRSVDPDPLVYTDNPYGTKTDTLESYLAPELPVGRLPDFDSGSPQDLVDLISALAENHRARAARQGSVAVFNSQWSPMTQEVAASLPAPLDQHQAPGYEITSAKRSDMDRRYLYFNLHGFQDDPGWKGFDPVRGQFYPVASPDSFDRQYVSGSVVYAENCYSGLIWGKTAATSCALRLMQQGAAAFVGATGLAFGSHIAPGMLLENADQLAQSFFESATTGGVSLGESLRRARKRYFDSTGVLSTNIFKQKTLLQFTYLGDPSLD